MVLLWCWNERSVRRLHPWFHCIVCLGRSHIFGCCYERQGHSGSAGSDAGSGNSCDTRLRADNTRLRADNARLRADNARRTKWAACIA